MGIESIGSSLASAARRVADVAARPLQTATQMAERAPSMATGIAKPAQAAMEAVRTASTPVALGTALRALDAAAGGRDKVAGFLGDNRDGRISDRRDDARTSGRDTVRPGKGNGPALPGKVEQGKDMPGYPTPPAAPKNGDGSKAHGSGKAGIKDHLVEDLCYRMADAADAMGLDNAARNLRHYLGNSGQPLYIDPNRLINDVPGLREQVDASYKTQVEDVAKAKIAAEYDGKPMQFTITTPWNGAYATQNASKDWYFATGGFSYAHTATVTVTPGKNGEAQVSIQSNVHTFDRYNWDKGKAVDIGPIHIEDKAMGRLHEVGLAREYELRGTGKGPSSSFTVKP